MRFATVLAISCLLVVACHRSEPEQASPSTSEQAQVLQTVITQEVCTKWHGDPAPFSPPLQTLLRSTYPEDRATGYQVGDLRGVIRVDIQRPDSDVP